VIETAALVDAGDRFQEDRLDPREHRGVDADADAERQNHDGRQSRHPADRAKRVTDHGDYPMAFCDRSSLPAVDGVCEVMHQLGCEQMDGDGKRADECDGDREDGFE
jgi:hypothetical protein